MKFFSMKFWPSLLAFLMVLCLSTSMARAGQWELENYYWSGASNDIDLALVNNYETKGYDTLMRNRKSFARNEGWLALENSHRTPYATHLYPGPLVGEFPIRISGVAPAYVSAGATVHAVFVWKRSLKMVFDANGAYTSIPDPDDNPPSYIYVRELGGAYASYLTHPGGHSTLDPWPAGYYRARGEGMDSGLQLGVRTRPETNPANAWIYGPNSKVVIRKIAVKNERAVVPSRSFHGDIDLKPGYEVEGTGLNIPSQLRFGYEADPLNVTLSANANSIVNRKRVTPDKEEIDALVELRWLYPEDGGVDANGNFKLTPERNWLQNQWDGFVTISGFGTLDDRAPLPYFQGKADFIASATRSDGQTPVFADQIYNWTPNNDTDPFSPAGKDKPVSTATAPNKRTYIWNFGAASEGEASFPKKSSVTVEVSSESGDVGNATLVATKKINWYTVWTPTRTGLQKNVVISQVGSFMQPDGSSVGILDVKPGDTIMCFVEGDPGFSTDGGRIEKIRPVPFFDQTPGPGERIEPRVVSRIIPTGPGEQIIIFRSTPQVRPDDDPDAPGFDEIQQTRQIQDTYIQTKETGRQLVTTALNLYVEAARFVSIGRLEGWGIEGAIKGVVSLGKLATAVREAKAGIVLLDEGAVVLRNRINALETLQRDARYSISQRAKFAEDAYSLRKSLTTQEQLANDARSVVATSEGYLAKASAEIKQKGCFVAGTLVWMGDGTTKPIEQVRVGDTVLSKNEQTGEVAAKKVLHTSVRQNIWTRKLSFDNGAILETTDEHPLYVEGRGFVKAKEVGIGSSIVTRAGPSAKVVGVEADVRRATVYNFTVDEFHNYFVGSQALWVHNTSPEDCRDIVALVDDSNKDFRLTQASAEKIFKDFRPSGAVTRDVAGSGGAGADIRYINANGAEVFKVEVKCIRNQSGFNDRLSYAAQSQAEGNLVVFQVPNGTDPEKWLARFWGSRQSLVTSTDPADIAKMNSYRTTDVTILDELGNVLLPVQKIYNPQ